MAWLRLALIAGIGILFALLYGPLIPTIIHEKPVTQHVSESAWDLHRHMGGYSPWIPKEQGILNTSIDPPAGCAVDQVHMMSRHGERYPVSASTNGRTKYSAELLIVKQTFSAGKRMLELYQRIQQANMTFQGDLEFLNRWNFFAPEPLHQFEQLVTTGPFAGTLSSFTTGVRLRTRYLPLLKAARANGKVSFWASHSDRVIETARHFAAGFFGLDWERVAAATLHVVPESGERGADTLTPGRSCANYVANHDGRGHGFGAQQLHAFRTTYLPAVARRLRLQNPGIAFDAAEVYSMQEMCGFETMAVGRSRWCEVFTEQEWLSFEYARDLLHYYRAGPGNAFGPSMGWLWLNATADLLRQGPDAGPLFFSFDHDGDIVALLGAMDVFHQEPDLPTSHVLHDREWRLSDVVPMGGRIMFERLACPKAQECWDNGPLYPNHVYCSPPTNDTFVRLNINDGIVAIPDCTDGPGQSCPLQTFMKWVEERGRALKPYSTICGLPEDAPRRIAFLKQ